MVNGLTPLLILVDVTFLNIQLSYIKNHFLLIFAQQKGKNDVDRTMSIDGMLCKPN